MKKSQHGTKDFLIGALIGSVIGVAVVTLSKTKSKHLLNTLTQAGKALPLTSGGHDIAEIIDWTDDGIQLWNQLKKQKFRTKKGR